jgi:hypothetical protein
VAILGSHCPDGVIALFRGGRSSQSKGVGAECLCLWSHHSPAKSLSTVRSKAGWNVVDLQPVGAFNEV